MSKPKGIHWNEIDLRELHWDMGLSTTEIAQKLNVSRARVVQRMEERNIQFKHKRLTAISDKPSELLHNLYWEEGLSLPEIATKLGMTPGAIRLAMERYSIPRRTISEAIKKVTKYGRDAHAWKGGRYTGKDGYVYIYETQHGLAKGKARYVPEHILVWEQVHNQPLPDGWVVHHINGIKDDNRPRNLLGLLKGKHHSQLVNNELKKRIREQEAEIKLLEKALDSQQLIFNVSEN